jgi:two-component system chemotaxis sensor kinase CheA
MLTDGDKDKNNIRAGQDNQRNQAPSSQPLLDDEMRAELLGAFKSELDEYLEALNRNLIKIEQSGVQEEILHEIFRTAHSMKGTAGAFGLTKIQKISHSMENLFGAVRRNEYTLDRPAFDLCYEGLDTVNRLMELELAGLDTGSPVDIEFAQRIDQLLNRKIIIETTAEKLPLPSPPPPPPPLPPPPSQPSQPAPVNSAPAQPEAQPACYLVDDAMRAELLGAFKSELDEYLEALNRNLIKIEQSGVQEEILHEIFRTAHSMKGTAGAFGLTKIQKISHSMENLFGAVRRNEYTLDRPAFDLCYEGLDTVNRLMELELSGAETPASIDIDFANRIDQLLKNQANRSVAAPTPAPAPVQVQAQEVPQAAPKKLNLPTATIIASKEGELPAISGAGAVAVVGTQSLQNFVPNEMKAAAMKSDSGQIANAAKAAEAAANIAKNESIRIPLAKIDQLMSDVGELIISRSRYEQRFSEVQNISVELALVVKELFQMRPLRKKLMKMTGGDKNLDKLLTTYDGCQNRLKNINSQLQLHTENSATDDLHLELIISSIQREVQGLRMLPIDTLFEPLRRRARDIARSQNKEVAIEFEGGDTELDRQLIEAMRDPMIHLITNSIDHGLEATAVRIQMGKSSTGRIRLAAGQRGNQIMIEITDDGNGINVERIKEKSINNGLYTARELELFSEHELLSLIFRPGFSTKSAVTEISGRGVGLDVVKVGVEKLQGQIEIATALGVGTTFRIILPLTLSTQRVLLIKCAGQIFGLPVNAVDRVKVIEHSEVYTIESKMAITLDGRALSLVGLDAILGIAEAQKDHNEYTALIINQGNERAAFIIDEVLGEQEMVLKSLGRPLRKLKNISGGTILGDGSVVLLLNPADLLRGVRSERRAPKMLKSAEVKRAKRKILIVDDSITTRTMEKNILENAGYEVFLAKDGMEGLEMARVISCELVISDVEMPRLTGIELTREIKTDQNLKHLPVILVSSLDSQQDKARGAQAGADAYIVKGQFDQKGFLEVVESMLAQ